MTGKAKLRKRTAKEIEAKADAALTKQGGGKAGLIYWTRKDKGGHAKFECPHYKVTTPIVKSMQIHNDAHHPKIPFEEAKVSNLHSSVATVADPNKPHLVSVAHSRSDPPTPYPFN